MDSTRRSALQMCGGAIVTGVAGCLGGSSEPELTFTADVIEQQSESGPARVEAALSNEGSTTVEIGFGPALLFSDDGPDDHPDWATELVLDPETRVGPPIEPERTDEECWRAPDDRDRPIQSLLEFRELSPEQSIQEEYDVYTWMDASSCLPEGSYRFQDDVVLEDESEVVLTLVLEVDSTQRLSATGEEQPTEAE